MQILRKRLSRSLRREFKRVKREFFVKVSSWLIVWIQWQNALFLLNFAQNFSSCLILSQVIIVYFRVPQRQLGFFRLRTRNFFQVVIMVDFLKEDSEALKHVSDPHFEWDFLSSCHHGWFWTFDWNLVFFVFTRFVLCVWLKKKRKVVTNCQSKFYYRISFPDWEA